MKLKKKWLMLTVSAVALLILFTAGIIAYSAASKRNNIVDNHLMVANLRGDIDETGFTPKEDIEIGDSASKTIKIENTGDTGLFVRVMVFPEIRTGDADSPSLLPANIGEEIEITLGTNWEDGEDGYFYYKGKVAPGAATPALFTEVALADDLDSRYVGATFDMQVKSETITASNLQYRKVWWNSATNTAPTQAKWLIVDTALAALVDP